MPHASRLGAMATPSSTTRPPEHAREADDDDDQTSIGELVERALAGARDLATHEASLALTELEQDVVHVRTAVIVAVVGASCISVALAWAGVALAWALSLGALGLGVGAAIVALAGAAALIWAARKLPPTILGKSRARLERRIARVTESLK